MKERRFKNSQQHEQLLVAVATRLSLGAGEYVEEAERRKSEVAWRRTERRHHEMPAEVGSPLSNLIVNSPI
jgi:hypothetical protein